jgi:hypothetical protein
VILVVPSGSEFMEGDMTDQPTLIPEDEPETDPAPEVEEAPEEEVEEEAEPIEPED